MGYLGPLRGKHSPRRVDNEAVLMIFQAEAVQTASQLDSLRSSHPIEVAVHDALEIDQIFDAISYLKGR